VRIGLYLEDYRNCSDEVVNEALSSAKDAELDLFVFPEGCYIPNDDDFWETDIFDENENDGIFDHALDISEDIGCAVIIGAKDINGYIYDIYANAFAEGDETEILIYAKHTMTDNSPLEFDNYNENIDGFLKPILLKSKKIGMTICYDCNHALFSRAYGKQNVDIIINTTGGNVVYDKWYRYNRVRAMENNCFSLCTMGYNESRKENSYTYGFTPKGSLMEPKYIYEGSRIGNIAVYDTDDVNDEYEECYNLYQAESDNAKGEMTINPDEFMNMAKDEVYSYNRDGIAYIIVKNNDIMLAEKILKEMYDTKNVGMRYMIVNVWDKLDKYYYETVLDDVLRVRSMENFCAVMLVSPEMTKCFQCGDNRTSQVIRKIDGRYRLDLRRMGGPNVIWKNKVGMRAAWRRGYEWLLDYLNKI
jgi:predicted amidohydrolase